MKKAPPSLDKQKFYGLGHGNRICPTNTPVNKTNDLEANCSFHSVQKCDRTRSPKETILSIRQEVQLLI